VTGPLAPGPGERLDSLSLARKVLQRARGHRSATDDVLAAWCAWQAAPGATRLLDLGCGHGTVSMYLTSVLPVHGVGVEAQAVSADLARRNMRLNGITDRISIHHGDLRSLTAEVLAALEGPTEFDLVTGTPPFMPPGTGVLPKDPQRAAARFELRGGIEEYCATAARFLAPGGSVSMLMDGSQDARCRDAVAVAGLHLRRRLVVLPREGRAPRYIGYVAGAEPQTEDDAVLTIRDAEGSHTAAYRAVRRALRIEAPDGQ